MAFPWLVEGLRAHANAKNDLDLVLEKAQERFDELRNRVIEISNQASAHNMGTSVATVAVAEAIFEFDAYMRLKPNPSPFKVQESSRKVHVSLSRDRRSIKATSDAGEQRFRITAENGVVSLTAETRSGMMIVSIEEAARMIMEPFLFGGDSPYSAHL